MVSIIEYIRIYWVQILFICTLLGGMFKFASAMIEATKCSLRNDILSIYDRCKDKKQITMYQKQSIAYSYTQYKALRGNSFVEDIVKKINEFEIVD